MAPWSAVFYATGVSATALRLQQADSGRSLLARPEAIAAVAAAILALTPAVSQAWEVRRFEASITVGSDARLTVVETIQISFGPERIQGITRSIPISLADPAGHPIKIQVRVLAVTDAGGRRLPSRITRSDRDLEFWIEPRDMFFTGEQTMLITYVADGSVLPGKTRDELYWQVTGYQWDVPMLYAEAVVILPAEVDPEKLDASSVVGKFGEKERPAGLKVADPSRVRFAVARGLIPHEAFLVSVAWPAGLVKHPGPLRQAVRFVARHLVLLLAGLALFVIGAWIGRRGGLRPRRGQGSVGHSTGLDRQTGAHPGVDPSRKVPDSSKAGAPEQTRGDD
jgi:hypothetical protein